MTVPAKTWKYLERDPHSSLKQLSIKGRRIRARTLYGQTVGDDARTPEQVAEDYAVPLEAVLEAIAYCESNPPEIAQDIRYSDLLMEVTGMNHPEYKYNPKKYYRVPTAEERRRIQREAYGDESAS